LPGLDPGVQQQEEKGDSGRGRKASEGGRSFEMAGG